jgi:predicted metal-binding membrane protein
VWTGFAAAATLAQWALHETALLSMDMVSTSPVLSGVLLVMAGVFQWTPYKHACLSHCRSPLSFLMGRWRQGNWGTFVMGLEHGSYCVGCCWLVMTLLFVAGVMNLLWIGVLSALVLAEKVLPRGEWIANVLGLAMVAAGVALLAGFRP